MRIIAGKNGGIILNTLDGKHTRPTLDRVKEALFSSIESIVTCYDNVLDLFAGSGALGLECISRYDSDVVFVDNSKKATRIILQNVKKCNTEEKAVIYNMDYSNYIKKASLENTKFDIIFLDPPYVYDGAKIISEVMESNILKDSGIIIYETDDTKNISRLECLENDGIIHILKSKKYGRVYLNYIGA